MKKILLFLSLILSISAAAQKKKKDILTSTSIPEIEAFLKTAHPEDPRRTVLKPKLIALKNAEWTKGSKTSKPMEARPIVVEIPNKVMRNSESNEAEEFKKLISETSDEHKAKTVKVLNTMFDQDINKKEAILLIQNNSDCNMIVRVQGHDYFNLAVPAHGENSLVLEKGQYKLTSNMCDIVYSSEKDIKKSMVVILNKPIYTAVSASSRGISNARQ